MRPCRRIASPRRPGAGFFLENGAAAEMPHLVIFLGLCLLGLLVGCILV